jgi:hypothetical protein
MIAMLQHQVGSGYLDRIKLRLNAMPPGFTFMISYRVMDKRQHSLFILLQSGHTSIDCDY